MTNSRLPSVAGPLLVFFVATMFAQQQRDECSLITFGGELKSGSSFTREIGNGLTFRLDPWQDEGGWEFEIGPAAPKQGEWDQYVYVLTPPYRNSSAREVNTGWGITAQDAVARRRQFWFLLSRAEAPQAEAAIEKVLWPKSDQDEATALRLLAGLQRGSGEFKILDSHITRGTPVPGYSDCQEGKCGRIHWIKFQVTLVVPSSFMPAKGLQATPTRCPDASPF